MSASVRLHCPRVCAALLTAGLTRAPAAGLTRAPVGLTRATVGLTRAPAAGLTRAPVGLRFFSAPAAGETRPNHEESTEEYAFVERLIPPSKVPAPPPHTGRTPSGWVPPSAPPPALPYTIRRSRLHNVPVYSDVTHGNRWMTVVRRVEGDIWSLDRDLKAFLKDLTGKEPATQVNEVTMSVRVKGHFHQELKEWLQQKGF